MSSFTKAEMAEIKKGGNNKARALHLASWTPDQMAKPGACDGGAAGRNRPVCASPSGTMTMRSTFFKKVQIGQTDYCPSAVG